MRVLEAGYDLLATLPGKGARVASFLEPHMLCDGRAVGAEPCAASADGWLVADSAEASVGVYCCACANRIVQEYRAKLGQSWRFLRGARYTDPSSGERPSGAAALGGRRRARGGTDVRAG